MQIYFHSCLCSYLPRVPILVEDTVYSCLIQSLFDIHKTCIHPCVDANYKPSTSVIIWMSVTKSMALCAQKDCLSSCFMHIHDKRFASPSPWVSDNANNVVKANLNFAVCIPSHADISNYISLIIQSSHQFDDTCQMVNLLINISH